MKSLTFEVNPQIAFLFLLVSFAFSPFYLFFLLFHGLFFTNSVERFQAVSDRPSIKSGYGEINYLLTSLLHREARKIHQQPTPEVPHTGPDLGTNNTNTQHSLTLHPLHFMFNKTNLLSYAKCLTVPC